MCSEKIGIFYWNCLFRFKNVRNSWICEGIKKLMYI